MTKTQGTKQTWWRSPGAWLGLGMVLLVASQLRWGVGLLAWIAPVPLLRYLRVTRGVGSRLWFAAGLTLAWIGATAKIVTAPLPALFAMLGLAFAAFQLVGYLGTDFVRRRLGDGYGVLAFVALMVGLEWLQHRATELGNWGAAANTQLGNLPLLQLASLFGFAGVSALVYAFAATVEAWLAADAAQRMAARRRVAVVAALVALAHVFGTLRLARGDHGQVAVAAIGTDATFDGSVMPTAEERARTLDRLLADTHAAASAGAKLAVWTEAAALVMPEEEDTFVMRVRQAALRDHVHVVAAYIVPKSTDPLRFENKYRWLRPDGAIDHTYFKHHPAPGEPAVVGRGALPIVVSELGRLGGGLCYDYDFPAFAREHGQAGVDLVALPSSDWRGIDPIHTQMAALRAIEQGVSIVRSTRFGLSAAIDPTGRMRALHSSFDGGSRVMLAQLPDQGRATLYRHTGDALVYAGFALLALMGLRIAVRGRQTRAARRALATASALLSAGEI